MRADNDWIADASERAEALGRVIAIVNEKGGVGKTTLTSNLAGQAAASGYRVLVVDLNRQANLALDLGYRGKEGVDDEGDGLLTALMRNRPLRVARDIRPGLDVVAGGEHLEDLTPVMLSHITKQGHQAFLALANALAPIAGDYDLTLIDCPPENTILDDLALGAARWVLIPTRSDDGGLDGMKLVAKRFLKAREINPMIGLLGVVLFATGTTAKAIHAEVRRSVAETFGGDSPLFQTTIRYAERIARDCRREGLLAHELEEAAKDQLEWWKMLREGQKVNRISSTAASVSADYQALAVEVLGTLSAAEGAEVSA